MQIDLTNKEFRMLLDMVYIGNWVSKAAELIGNNRELFVDFEITKGKMDDVFLAVTGKELHGGVSR